MSERDGLVYGLDERLYHAGDELSSTGARQILDSPARFQYKQQNPMTSAAFDLGTAVHSKVLGFGSLAVAYPPEHLTASGNVSTKAVTVAWADEQRASGYVPVTPDDMARVDAMAEAVLAHPVARRIVRGAAGSAEVSAFATDPETGVRCRARFDYLDVYRVAADLKTTSGSASRTGFGHEAAKYGYPIQEAHYLDTLEWVTGERLPMLFVVVEKAPPYLVAVHEFDEVTRMAARELAAKARRIYAECTAADEWPGYGDDLLTTELPAWWWHRVEDEDEVELKL